MAIKTHIIGKIVIEASELGQLKSSTLTVNINTGDTSKIGTPWESSVELGKNWEVAAECDYDPADTAQAAMITAYTSGDVALSSLDVYEDASVMHTGSALLTSAVITKTMGSVDKLSLSFKGIGALSHA